MKKRFILSLGVAAMLFSAFTMGEEKDIALGTTLPMADKAMKSINDKPVSMADLAGDQGLIVVFSCNTCPFVLGWEDRYNEIYDLAQANDIGMVLLNSNEAKRDGADSRAEMKAHATTMGYKMAYLVDENSEVAKAFGATVTPQAYLFDANMKLVYKGLIDDNMKDKDAATPHLANAIEDLVAGEPIETAKTRAQGCSIKKIKS